MAKRKQKDEWLCWDDQQLATLQGIVGNIHNTVFSLENLCQRWERMLDTDAAELVIEQLREAHEALAEVFENLEEQRDEACE